MEKLKQTICQQDKQFDTHAIKHYVTRNHAAFAEIFIRTLKDMLYKRIDGESKKRESPMA